MTDAALADEGLAPQDVAPEQPDDGIKLDSAQEVSAPLAEEKPQNDGFQKRINKVTADKYAEKRRADELERKLNEMTAAAPATQAQASTAAPTLEQFDFDQEAFNAALINHAVDQRMAAATQKQDQAVAAGKQADVSKAFNVKVADFTAKTPDYQEVIGNIPELPGEVFDAIMQAENGPELAYALGQRLDLADEIASSSPMVAAMKLGELTAQLANVKPTPKQSAAPAPIEPVASGGALDKDLSDMTVEEICALD